MNKPILKIGIDPGVNTGFAMFDPETRELTLHTLKIHQAFVFIESLKGNYEIDVFIENPNLVKYFKDTSFSDKSRIQGAGSVKRDFKAWEDFFKDHGITYQSFRPNKKRNAFAEKMDLFSAYTGYKNRCSHHARVAAMLIYNKTKNTNEKLYSGKR